MYINEPIARALIFNYKTALSTPVATGAAASNSLASTAVHPASALSSSSSSSSSSTPPPSSSSTLAVVSPSGADSAGLAKATDFCKAQKYTQDDWNSLGLDNVLPATSGGFDGSKTTLNDFWVSRVPGLTGNNYDCSSNKPQCDATKLTEHDYCASSPGYVLLLTAMSRYINYIISIQKTFDEVTTDIHGALPKLPSIFSDNKTQIGGSTPANAAYASTGLGIAGAFLGFLGPIGLIGKTAGAVASGTASAASQSLAAVTSLTGKDGTDPEPQFETYDHIAWNVYMTGTATHHAINGILDKIYTKGEIIDFQKDTAFYSDAFKGGAFLVDIGVNPDHTNKQFDLLRSALVAPAINTIWSWWGVGVIKFGKDFYKNIGYKGDYDPCGKDAPFGKDIMYCDDAGNAFVLQRPDPDPNNWDNQDTSKYAVKGWDQLSQWGLSPKIVTQASQYNQIHYGVGGQGQKPEDLLNDLVKSPDGNLPLERYAFFNLPVCDMDRVDVSRAKALIGTECTNSRISNQPLCYLYFAMQLCSGLQALNTDKNHWVVDGKRGPMGPFF